MTRTRNQARRRIAAVLIAGALLSGGCSSSPGAPTGSRTLDEMAAAVGADVIEHLQQGYFEGRSPDVAFVPQPWNTVVRFRAEGLGTSAADPRSSHPTPWDYHQRVPIMLYGPGYVRSGATSTLSIDVADLAPTFTDLLGFGFDAPNGEVLHEALLPPRDRNGAPRVVVVVAYDGVGWNLLAQWPDAWPTQLRLAREGTTYTNATIGSAPSVTAAIHATMGTGAYPQEHGLSENVARLPDGRIGEIYFDEANPRLLEAETLADAWDRENDNRPWVGLLGYESWHLGMMGQGSQSPGGDADVAVLWEPETSTFFTNEDVYTLPDYLPGADVLDEHLRDLDASDGARDGLWMGHDLGDETIVPGTPAFVNYQGDALVEILKREPVGRDGLTDFLFVELKPADFGGHIWNMVAPEEEFVLRAQDEVLGRLVEFFDEEIGPRNYVLALTADHGQTPLPETKDGVRIHPDVLGRRVQEHFGDVVEQVTPSGIYLNSGVIGDRQIRLEDVARFIGDLTYRDCLPSDADFAALPESLLDERIFAGAFPGSFLAGLSDSTVRSFGDGRYPEGDLHTAPRLDVLGY
ncbi:MAG: alkaline phosphatase family protein [Actinomycetota bacterium]